MPSRRFRTIPPGLLLILLWAGVPAHAGEAAVEGATVRWDEDLEALGREAARAMSRVRGEVSGLLGWRYEGPPVEVVLVAGLDRLREEARARVPDWAVGVAIPSSARIVIRSDLLRRGFGGGVVPVLRHEWVHLTWGWRAGPVRRLLPLWFEEGLAEDIGGAVSVDAGATLDLAVTFGRLHQFSTLERRFPEDMRGAGLAYRQSRSWVRFLRSRAGWGAVQRILADVAREGPDVEASRAGVETPFERHVRQHTGRTVGEWHAAWIVSVEEEASPWFHLLLRDFPGLIIAGLAVLAAGLFFFLVRRRRRQIERLPDGPPFEER